MFAESLDAKKTHYNCFGKQFRRRIMKKIIILLAVSLLLPVAGFTMVDEPIIDFGKYESMMTVNMGSTNAPLFDKQGTPNFVMTPEMMNLDNWVVELQTSGKRTRNVIRSICKKVYSKMQKQDVLGVRVNFPKTRENDIAIVKPKFKFNAYATNGNFANIGNGVVQNVGLIKELYVWVKGRNYPFGLSLRLVDRDHKMTEYYFGHLGFDNWRRLSWVNPNYINKLKDRIIVRTPLYPQSIPYMMFKEIVIYRQMDQIGGDFIVYFKKFGMRYEVYSADGVDVDINDEKIWNILSKKAIRNMKDERKKLAERNLDYKRMKKRIK